MNINRLVVCLGALLMSLQVAAQGEDSLRSERDLQVVTQLLPGIYANGNQAYFERRTGVAEELRHGGLRVDISTAGDNRFDVAVRENGGGPGRYQMALAVEPDRDQVKMTLSQQDQPDCLYTWIREAQQFRAVPDAPCGETMPLGFVLGSRQFWVEPSTGGNRAAGAYQLHRSRSFSCYVDIPGVGGGRDIPYERYEGIELHDQWDAHWFETRESPPRKLGISLALVDWPINNYNGVFTRDSLVIYVSEEVDGERKEHGYAFTVPYADRVGINLKWLLASCFMTPNSEATPSM